MSLVSTAELGSGETCLEEVVGLELEAWELQASKPVLGLVDWRLAWVAERLPQASD